MRRTVQAGHEEDQQIGCGSARVQGPARQRSRLEVGMGQRWADRYGSAEKAGWHGQGWRSGPRKGTGGERQSERGRRERVSQRYGPVGKQGPEGKSWEGLERDKREQWSKKTERQRQQATATRGVRGRGIDRWQRGSVGRSVRTPPRASDPKRPERGSGMRPVFTSSRQTVPSGTEVTA
jgi:hypothetical protein